MRTKRTYDPDFKREAVRLVVEESLGVREVERNLEITHGVLKDGCRNITITKMLPSPDK